MLRSRLRASGQGSCKSAIRCQRGRRLTVMAAVAPVVRTSVSSKMEQLKAAGKTALVPFICAGDPDMETTAQALVALDAAGCDVIELGIPYSDPLADGPTIQSAADRALSKGCTLQKVIDMLAGCSDRISAPIVLFCYFNPIMARGLDKFCADIRAAGASGLLVPDIPLEETVEIRAACNAHSLELVLLTTPTTGAERMARIAEATQGFLYLVSVTGVTGARAEVSTRVEQLVRDIKAASGKPVNVGFGVSTPAQAKQLKDWGADGVIIGSALVRELGESASPAEGLQKMTTLIQSIRSAI